MRRAHDVRGQGSGHVSATVSIAGKIGTTLETLRRWIRQGERDSGLREGLSTFEQQRIKALELENRELHKSNEILKLASTFFAQAEHDRRFKP